MTIEHRHFKTTKDIHDKEGTWTIKVRHTFTACQDAVNNSKQSDIQTSEQLATAISNPFDNSRMLPDGIAFSEPIRNATTTTEDPTIQVGTEFLLPSNDTSGETVSFEEAEETRTETSDSNKSTGIEKENLMAAEERRKIMERYPRSRSLGHYTTQHINYRKGYKFYPGVSSLAHHNFKVYFHTVCTRSCPV